MFILSDEFRMRSKQVSPGEEINGAVKSEIVLYLMSVVLTAPPYEREKSFAAVRSAMAVWLPGGRDELRSQNARSKAESGFGGIVRQYFERLDKYSPRSQQWLTVFRDFSNEFEHYAGKSEPNAYARDSAESNVYVA